MTAQNSEAAALQSRSAMQKSVARTTCLETETGYAHRDMGDQAHLANLGQFRMQEFVTEVTDINSTVKITTPR